MSLQPHNPPQHRHAIAHDALASLMEAMTRNYKIGLRCLIEACAGLDEATRITSDAHIARFHAYVVAMQIP